MNSRINKSVLTAFGVLAAGAVRAHTGTHGGEGFLAGIAHLLGEHGYLVLILAIVGAAWMRRSDRA